MILRSIESLEAVTSSNGKFTQITLRDHLWQLCHSMFMNDAVVMNMVDAVLNIGKSNINIKKYKLPLLRCNGPTHTGTHTDTCNVQ